jgi:flavin reductase (DIM6/NTAB) family NADH-FMN oxidoreductase RutF
MIIDPKTIPAPIAYQVLTGAVIPRPIGFISSISKSGLVNLAPFSFFNAVCGEPPMVIFAPMNRKPVKDTLINVKETGEFVANIVSRDIAEQMNITAGDYPYGVNEFEVSGLTPLPCNLVRPPRVKESPVNMECKVQQIIEVSSKPWGGHLVLGEVVLFHVRDDIIDRDLFIDPDKLNPIARMGGPSYSTIKDRFDMIRPVINPEDWIGWKAKS